MKKIAGIFLSILFSTSVMAESSINLVNWTGMNGKVARVNVDNFPFLVKNGIGILSYKGELNSDAFGAPGIEIDAQPYLGKKISFKAQLKTTESKGSSIWMRVDGDDGMLAFDNGSNRNLKGSESWHDFEVILPVAKDSKNILLGLLHYSAGSVSIRNPRIEVTDAKSTATFLKKETFSMDLKNWTMNMGDPRLYSVNTKAGTALLSSTGKKLTKNEFASLTENFVPTQFIGHRVKFSADIKTEDVSNGYAGLWMRVDGKDSAKKFDGMRDRGLTGTNDWKRVSVVLDVEDNTVTNLSFGTLLVGYGKVWIKNPTFSSVGTHFSTTN